MHGTCLLTGFQKFYNWSSWTGKDFAFPSLDKIGSVDANERLQLWRKPAKHENCSSLNCRQKNHYSAIGFQCFVVSKFAGNIKRCQLDKNELERSASCKTEGGEMPFLTFETRSRFCFLQSRASRRDRDFFTKSQGSRRDRDFCSLNLRLRDEIEIFCHLISKFETRSRFFNEIFPPMWYSKLHLFIYNKYIFLNKKISKICISCWQ